MAIEHHLRSCTGRGDKSAAAAGRYGAPSLRPPGVIVPHGIGHHGWRRWYGLLVSAAFIVINFDGSCAHAAITINNTGVTVPSVAYPLISIPDGIYVANNSNSTGSLTIGPGGQVTSGAGIIGYLAGANGTAVVTGAGSFWKNTLTSGGTVGINVGFQGKGSLTVSAGGAVTGYDVIIGNSSTSSGTVEVTGQNSTLAVGRNLQVGQSGIGELLIRDRGAVDAGNMISIASSGTGLGTVTVTDAGSTLTTAGNMFVGSAGTGYLTIRNGANAASYSGSIANTGSSVGKVVVTGLDSTWSMDGDLVVGASGTGTLTISDHGRVDSNMVDGWYGGCIGGSYGGPNSAGTVLVTGGSTWSNGDTLTVGNTGQGELTINYGGMVSAPEVTIANLASATGKLNIGAAEGSAAVAAGTLETPTVDFGLGSGTIVFNHSNTDYIFSPAISSGDGTDATAGTVKVLSGTTIMTGASSYFGDTLVAGGTLRAGAGGVFSINSDYTVSSVGTSVLDVNGFNQTVAGLTNAGLVNMGTGTPPGTVLTVRNYVGQGGAIAMNTYLGVDGSPSDKLVINGGTASGNSLLLITDHGGPGAVTISDGILVVDTINGGTTEPAAFTLSGRAVAGVYEYKLFRGGVGGSTPDNWYLRSELTEPPPPPEPPPPSPPPPPPEPLYRPEVGSYLANQRMAGGWLVTSLHDRLGEPQSLQQQQFNNHDKDRDSIWLRLVGKDIGSTSGNGIFDVDSDEYLLQGGGDIAQWSVFNDKDRLHLGLMAGYHWGQNFAAAKDNPARSKGDVQGVSIGAYGTWYENKDDLLGWYVDLWGQYGWFTNHVYGEFLPEVRYNSQALALSAETGYAKKGWLPSDWLIEPQAQLIYARVDQDDVLEQNGTSVTDGNGSGWISRLGVRLHRTWTSDSGKHTEPYLTLNWWHDATDSGMSFNQIPEGDLYPQNRYEIKLGINLERGDVWSGWVNIGEQWGSQNYHAYIGRIGIKYSW